MATFEEKTGPNSWKKTHYTIKEVSTNEQTASEERKVGDMKKTIVRELKIFLFCIIPFGILSIIGRFGVFSEVSGISLDLFLTICWISIFIYPLVMLIRCIKRAIKTENKIKVFCYNIAAMVKGFLSRVKENIIKNFEIEYIKKFIFYASIIAFVFLCYYLVSPKWIYYKNGMIKCHKYSGKMYIRDRRSNGWKSFR